VAQAGPSRCSAWTRPRRARGLNGAAAERPREGEACGCPRARDEHAR
jgi:hypothetical protein